MRVYIRWATKVLLALSFVTVLLLAMWSWSRLFQRPPQKNFANVAPVLNPDIVARASRPKDVANQEEPGHHVTKPTTTPRELVDTPTEEVIKLTLKYLASVNPPPTAPNRTQSDFLKSYTTTADTYLQRKKTFTEACKKHGHLLKKASQVRVLWLKPNAMTMCLIEKCSSTFIGQILYLLHGRAPTFYSPLQVHPGFVYGFFHTIRNALTDTVNQTSVRHSVFVRDPYSRLFSGYIDKLFTPNVFFWGSQGATIVSSLRNTTKGEKYIGHDVTFAELARFVTTFDTGKVDPHFTPLYSMHCITCDVAYDIIGKAETSGDDLAYFLDSIGQMKNNLTFSNPSKERAYDKILDKLGQLWRSMRGTKNYIPLRRAALRVWRSFQIEGLISVSAQCPPGLELLPFEEAVQVTLAHLDLSPDVKAQKKEAMVQAYLSLPDAHLLQLQKVLEPDADLFGYSAWPSAIFEDREQKRRDMASHFQYFDVADDENKE